MSGASTSNREAAAASAGSTYGENEAAVLDAFVVPSYLRIYWDLTKRLILAGQASRVVHLGCRTGYPHAELLDLMANTEVTGVDASEPCLALARNRTVGTGLTYLRAEPTQTGLPGNLFSHLLLLHPLGDQDERLALFAEGARLLYPGGQALVALPLGQSFPEMVDLLAEYALKTDDGELTSALEATGAHRATVESVSEELEAAGFADVDFELGGEELVFDSGRALMEDPSVRFMVVPQLRAWLGGRDLSTALDYVARAVDKYWSDERMTLSIKLAAFSARR